MINTRCSTGYTFCQKQIFCGQGYSTRRRSQNSTTLARHFRCCGNMAPLSTQSKNLPQGRYFCIVWTREDSKLTASVQVSHFFVIRITHKYGRTFSNPLHEQSSLLVRVHEKCAQRRIISVDPRGFEPPTPSVQMRCSTK